MTLSWHLLSPKKWDDECLGVSLILVETVPPILCIRNDR